MQKLVAYCLFLLYLSVRLGHIINKLSFVEAKSPVKVLLI